jgi:hypothetical protein
MGLGGGGAGVGFEVEWGAALAFLMRLASWARALSSQKTAGTCAARPAHTTYTLALSLSHSHTPWTGGQVTFSLSHTHGFHTLFTLSLHTFSPHTVSHTHLGLAGAVDGQLDPVADGDVLGLAHAPDVPRRHLVLHQRLPERSGGRRGGFRSCQFCDGGTHG